MARLLAPALCLLVLVCPASPASAAPHAATPRITASPSSIMVNGTTKLTGLHFGASASITLEECGTSSWVVTANPCTTGNSVTVTTTSKGRFKAVLTAKLCAGSQTVGTSEMCYLGEPMPYGVDTIRLLGVVALTVTWP